MKRISNIPVDELRERARLLIEESERIIERARQIEVETRALVGPATERASRDPLAADSRPLQTHFRHRSDTSD